MYVYARINKETMKFIRETKAITLDYVSRITKYSSSKIELWENSDTDKFPTINQAKSIAKCYRVPFAGLYMNANDINIKHLPKVRNLRTLPDATLDNSALNLAIIDVLSARDLLIESKIALHENMSPFAIQAVDSEDVNQWAKTIREELELSIDVQYGCQSTRQFYLYVRNAVERAGVFVHCFTGIETEIVRGFAIYEDFLPIIGLNNEDRYPAKTFTIFHELVHLMKRSSAVCNDMISHDLAQHEEVFCNAVAGEILVPKLNLIRQLGSLTTDEIDLNLISKLAAKFSVSKEVISRRLLDIGTCSEIIEEVNDDALKQWYIGLSGEILPIDDEVQENVKKVVTTNPQLIDFHKVKSSGDAFLIATAMKYGLTVITEESKKGEKKIPFVCQNLHVPCVDILGLCEKEGWSF